MKELLDINNWEEIEDINCLSFPTNLGTFCIFQNPNMYECGFIPKRGTYLELMQSKKIEDCIQKCFNKYNFLNYERFSKNDKHEKNYIEKLKRDKELQKYMKINKSASIDKVANEIINAIHLILRKPDEFIMRYQGTRYLIEYGQKDKEKYFLRIKKIEGEDHREIKTGVYVGSPAFIVDSIKNIPKVLQTINYVSRFNL
jgi:hypothetical protein